MRLPSLLSSGAARTARGFVGRSRLAAAAGVASLATACVGAGGLTMLEGAPKASAAIPAPFARIVSYNVLSSHLCEPDHFIKCKPEDLDPPTRLSRVQDALAPHMDKEAVICLQEVSVTWVGPLTQFFEERGYTMVSGNYGAPFNGYMGVSLAWPKSRFESEAIDITRASDVRKWPKPPPSPPPPGLLVRGWRAVKQLFGAKPPKPPFDVVHESKRRHNFVVSARLRCKRSGARFAVSTYHMPCLFGSDAKLQVMTTHAALAAQHALRFADGVPCVLAGDFNFAPDSAPYDVITKGSLPDGHVHAPKPAEGDAWRAALSRPFASAYVAAGAGEPDFTNLATTKFMPNEPFVGTLDYIFLSQGQWAARHVRPLPHRDTVMPTCSSYPTADEPSDHVAIWADVDLVSPGGGAAAAA